MSLAEEVVFHYTDAREQFLALPRHEAMSIILEVAKFIVLQGATLPVDAAAPNLALFVADLGPHRMQTFGRVLYGLTPENKEGRQSLMRLNARLCSEPQFLDVAMALHKEKR